MIAATAGTMICEVDHSEYVPAATGGLELRLHGRLSSPVPGRWPVPTLVARAGGVERRLSAVPGTQALQAGPEARPFVLSYPVPQDVAALSPEYALEAGSEPLPTEGDVVSAFEPVDEIAAAFERALAGLQHAADELAAVAGDLPPLEQRIAAVEDAMGLVAPVGQAEELTRLEGLLAQASEAQAALTQRADDAERERESETLRASAAVAEGAELSTRLAAATQAREGLAAERDALAARVDEALRERDALAARQDATQEELRATQARVDALTAELEDVSAQVAAAGRERDVAASERDAAATERARLEAEIEELRAQLQARTIVAEPAPDAPAVAPAPQQPVAEPVPEPDAPAAIPVPAPSRRRIRPTLPVLMFAVGSLAVTDAVLTMTWKEPISSFYAARQQSALDDDLQQLDAKLLDVSVRLPRIPSATERMEVLARRLDRDARAGDALGRLRVPRLGLDYVVVHGTGSGELKRGPGHYSTSPLPGERGTVGIAGHRTTYGAPFRRVDELRRGDTLRMRMPYGDFEYVVEGSRIVKPSDTTVLRNVRRDRLVLTACHPLYSASKRIVVIAALRSATPRGAALRIGTGSGSPASGRRGDAAA